MTAVFARRLPYFFRSMPSTANASIVSSSPHERAKCWSNGALSTFQPLISGQPEERDRLIFIEGYLSHLRERYPTKRRANERHSQTKGDQREYRAPKRRSSLLERAALCASSGARRPSSGRCCRQLTGNGVEDRSRAGQPCCDRPRSWYLFYPGAFPPWVASRPSGATCEPGNAARAVWQQWPE